MAKASVIIAVYNKMEFLRFVLAGYSRQSFRDFEIIIADDGSNEESLAEIRALIESSVIPMQHVWQEDLGFRKTKILNQAILNARSEYVIFTDGDCVPHREFVREHFRNRKLGVCLVGRRVNLSERMTARLTVEGIATGVLERDFLGMLMESMLRRMNYVEKGIYVRSPLLRKIVNRKKRNLVGSNFSLHKTDVLSVNGFDERYEAPGIGEDSDIQIRLARKNIVFESMSFAAIQYHLYHPQREIGKRNLELLEEAQSSRIAFTPFGIHKTAVS